MIFGKPVQSFALRDGRQSWWQASRIVYRQEIKAYSARDEARRLKGKLAAEMPLSKAL
jgi:hypothetical protein